MLKQGDIIINVVDATNLERNLNLTLQLLEKGLPLMVALNMWDDTRHRGINIDVSRLEKLLGVPVVPTVGVTGEGIKELAERIPQAAAPHSSPMGDSERWAKVGDIVSQVQSLSHRHHTWREVLEDISNHPAGGAVLAILVLVASFWVIRLIGEGIISYITDPFFQKLWSPLLMKLSGLLGAGSIWHSMLIGKLINGQIDYLQSFGLLSTGLYIEFGVVIPYILSFYLVLGILEDVGYLPRLAVLADTMLHRLGLHGYAIIPTILGLGCNVPAVMATRILESRKQRFIAATLISIAVPCAALQAMIIGLVGQQGWQYVAMVYGTLFLSWVAIGLILNRTVKGFSPELLVEIPPYRFPPWRVVGEKLWLRIYGFIKEALPIVLGAVLAVNILYTIGVFDFIANITAPVVSGLLGLPKETVVALAIGFVRKDVAVGMLAPLGLTPQQLVISSTVLAMLFPCVATFAILSRELGWKDMLKATGIMIVSALVAGSLQNLILQR
jgi:ferrous iron transport protein B